MVKTLKWFITAIFFALIIVSCDDKQTEAEKLGVYQSGEESQLNDTWSGKVYDGLGNLTIVFNDGKVVERWISGYGLLWHATANEGYIGYYSYDGNDFYAVMGADEMKGTVDGQVISGTFNESGDLSTFNIKK